MSNSKKVQTLKVIEQISFLEHEIKMLLLKIQNHLNKYQLVQSMFTSYVSCTLLFVKRLIIDQSIQNFKSERKLEN